MKSKRILSMMLAIVMVFAMTACAKKVENTGAEEAATPTATEAVTPAATEEATPEPTKEAETIQPVTIEYWHAMSGGPQDELTKLTDKFNAENGKGITVKLVNQGSYDDLSKKLMGSVAAKTLPDMAQVYDSWIINYLDAVVPLDDFVNSDFDNYDDIVESYRNESKEFGKIYTMPFNKSIQLYFYNKTEFDKLGLGAPKTWEDLKNIGKTIYDADKKPALGYDDLAAMFWQLVLQNGSEFIENGEVKFNNAQGIEALNFFLDMYKKGYARVAGEDKYMSGPFGNGDCMAYIGSSAGLSYIKTNGFELGVAPLPAGKAGAVPSAGTNLAMFAQDRNKQLAVWEYMKYLTSADATAEWSIATGYLPVRLSAFQSSAYQTYMKGSEAAQASYAQIDNQYFEGAYKGANEVRSLLSSEVEAAILNGETGEKAVPDIAAKVEAILKK
ncbi:multiple sugar transport system substrate-binding protein [Anaerocolumna jejuensis DSM 15929]|uniref:Multiple sugar transport system substrate-binding protein n=1 Tax=Anaerocolumna jejuensis DSM 15929 TaxID=1121322 RepID=A0A1M6VMF4_9FIRM|nr:ABC transporter substrate-binding protein [Anaerocolumna jejuensis]SHK82680.1 multiple sugar transport system substrate-binding protein [Anaerocolumna jejuensis DSM 15929]